MKALVRSLDGRHLVIQGPPGSGKTWTSGRLIADLIAHGKTVGVASTSHKAIHKLLDEVEAAAEIGLDFDGLKKASDGNPESFYEAATQFDERDRLGRVRRRRRRPAGTAWHFARERTTRTLDYLFIDEAGQVSLADALAMGTCGAERRPRRRPAAARAGDPGHAPGRDGGVGADVAARRRADDPARPRPLPRAHVPAAPGRLRATSRTSSTRGGSARTRATAARTTPLGTGLRYVRSSTRATGRSRRRRSTAVRGARRASCVGAGDRRSSEVMVVAPYNAQVNALREALPAGVARRHGRQVPGPGGRRRRLLDGELERRRRPARPRVPALAEPAERRGLAGAVPRVPRREPAPARGELPDDRPDAARERALPLRRAGDAGLGLAVRALRGAEDVGEDAVLGRHQLVLWTAGGFLHRDQVVEGRDADPQALEGQVLPGRPQLARRAVLPLARPRCRAARTACRT